MALCLLSLIHASSHEFLLVISWEKTPLENHSAKDFPADEESQIWNPKLAILYKMGESKALDQKNPGVLWNV